MIRSAFGRLRSEGERVALPNECEENDRAVRYLAKETGTGHYDNINLLVMAVLFIFVSVAFLTVNGGKASSSKVKAMNRENLMSGEFTESLEKSYLDQLPIPDEIKRANEVVSLFYGFGNKLSAPGRKSFTSNSGNNSGASQNAFERDENDHKENAVTMGTQTDENGNIMTTEEVVKTAPGGGTTAVGRTDMAMNSSAAVSTQPGETTTTNNDAPVVTTTTTTIVKHSRSETQTSASSAADSSQTTEPTDSSEPDIPTDSSEPDITEPDNSQPDDDSQPDITDPVGGDDTLI